MPPSTAGAAAGAAEAVLAAPVAAAAARTVANMADFSIIFEYLHASVAQIASERVVPMA